MMEGGGTPLATLTASSTSSWHQQRQCGDDLSRENILKQAKSLQDLALPTAMPGITINTSATSNMIWTQLQLQRWTGANWEQFGEVLDVKSE